MQMMYDIISQELKSINIENSHPEDYLNFYCLGNREELPKEVSVPPDQSSQNGSVSYSLKFISHILFSLKPSIFNLKIIGISNFFGCN